MGNAKLLNEFIGEIELLSHQKTLAFSAFCAQISIGNVDVYERAINQEGKLSFNSRMDLWFWSQLAARKVAFPYDYATVENELLEVILRLEEYPTAFNLNPKPDAILVRESIYLFSSCCKFFSGIGDPEQLVTILDNCMSQKIEAYYYNGLEINSRANAKGMEVIYEFPVYKHAVADIDWALNFINQEDDDWVSSETLKGLKTYAKDSSTFVTRTPIYLRQ